MAKAKTTENKPAQVPAAELVGDHANLTDKTDDANNSTAAGLADGMTTAAFYTSGDITFDHGKELPVEGTEVSLGIDLGDGSSILTVAEFKDGILTLDVATFELADLMTIVGRADDDDKREILKALQSYLGLPETDVQSDIEHIDPADLAHANYCAAYPALSRAMDDWKASGRTEAPTMRIVSKIEGFWRAGMQHSTAPVEIEMTSLSPENADLLLSEPNLIIEFI